MSATTAGTKTVTVDISQGITAAKLTTLLAKPIELLTVYELETIQAALKHVSGGREASRTIGSLLT